MVSLENGCVGSHLCRLVDVYKISCPGFLKRNGVQVITEKHQYLKVGSHEKTGEGMLVQVIDHVLEL